MNKYKIRNPQSTICNGFTLMELLVVIAIIGMLAGILMPTLNVARERGRRAVCVGNLKVLGEAFNMYNIDIGEMPPTKDAFLPPVNTATNIIGIQGVSYPIPIGLGYFYNDPNQSSTKDDYIEDFAAYVCPSSDYLRDPKLIKQDWNANINYIYSAYIYRSESGYLPPATPTLMLSDARPAIVMDYNEFNASPPPPSKYNHKGEYVTILFRNGNVKGVENKDGTGTTNKNGQLTLGGTGPGGTVDKNDLFRYEDSGILKGGADNYQ